MSKTVKMSGAKALIESLKRQKSEVIFGIIGGSIMPVYDALLDSGLRHIQSRHEQCSAHEADGYARVSGKPGLCMATSGPGATNLVTGIANAYMDSSPIIAFTGQVNTYAPNSSWILGKDAFQEADITGITLPITKHRFQVKKANAIPKTVKMAFHIATSGRPGPVLVDLPNNVQKEIDEMNFSEKYKIRGYQAPSYTPHPLQIKKAVKMLLESEKPLILAGGGVTISNAFKELLQLAEFMMIPVATTLMGKSTFPENHPLYIGHVGMHGSSVANKLILETDVLLAIGTRFSDRSTGALNCYCSDAKIIHIDIDSAEIGKNVQVELPIVADAKTTLKSIYNVIVDKVKKKEESLWFNRIQKVKTHFNDSTDKLDGNNLTPKILLKELREILPEDAIIATEVGQNQMWTALHFRALKPRTFITSGGLGTMGFGFPASLGAKVARPEKVVVDIAGDGSFMMTEQELSCSITENIPVTVIILNNSMLGMVAQWQRLFYNRRYSAVKLDHSPDFVKLAEAYGAQGIKAASKKEFSKAVKIAIKSEVTTVIDVPISPEHNVFPMVPPSCGLDEVMVG